MVKSKRQKPNRIILEIHPVHSDSVESWASVFTIKIRNSVDTIHSWPNNNDEDVKGYIEKEILEERLEFLRKHISNLVALPVDEIRLMQAESEIMED